MKIIGKFSHLIYFFFFALGSMFLQSCAVYNPENLAIVPVSDIVRMSKDGVTSKAIINQMRESHSVYMLPADQLAKLKSEGVQDSVINYMQKTHLNAVRREQRMEDYYNGYPGMYGYPYYGYGFGWPYYGYWDWGFRPSIIIHRGGPAYRGGYQRSAHSGRR